MSTSSQQEWHPSKNLRIQALRGREDGGLHYILMPNEAGTLLHQHKNETSHESVGRWSQGSQIALGL